MHCATLWGQTPANDLSVHFPPVAVLESPATLMCNRCRVLTKSQRDAQRSLLNLHRHLVVVEQQQWRQQQEFGLDNTHYPQNEVLIHCLRADVLYVWRNAIYTPCEGQWGIFLHHSTAHWLFSFFVIIFCKPHRWLGLCWSLLVDEEQWVSLSLSLFIFLPLWCLFWTPSNLSYTCWVAAISYLREQAAEHSV